MKHSQKFTVLIFFILLIIITANYLFYTKLTEPKFIIQHNETIEEKILKYSKNLPSFYIKPVRDTNNNTQIFLLNIRKYYELDNVTYLWKLAHSWVTPKQIVNPIHEEIGKVYGALKYASIIRADLDQRGTQLKFLLTLQGNQDVVFKPKWYEKDKVLNGPVYGGKDRHTSEIVAFYLSIILDMPFTPFTVERQVKIMELTKVATRSFHDTTIIVNNNTCVYGKCYYCTKKDPICADQYRTLTGAVIFNIHVGLRTIRSPWIRTYKNKKASWETDISYCKIVKRNVSKTRLLDMIDTSIFDFFIQNGDRHHYEMMGDRIVLLDNGKGLGNPYKHHVDILAPLYQCCMIRKKTWRKLLSLNENKLSYYLRKMPDLSNFLMDKHLEAIDERLDIIYGAIEYCRNDERMVFI